MQDYPHIYKASARAFADGDMETMSPDCPTLATAPPPEFGGPGGKWSPETLLVASVADCLILTFRAIARASKFDWIDLQCSAEGRLEKVDRKTLFTAFHMEAVLKVPEGASHEKAGRLLEMAERNCLITNSLLAEVHLDYQITE